MKRLLCIILIGLNILIVGCGSQNIAESKSSDTTSTKEVSSQSSENSKDDTENEIELNKSFDVKTELGEYKFTITGVRKTDWWQRDKKNTDKTVILLDLECENIDFTNKEKTGFDGVELYDAFTVKDNNNYMLNHFSGSYDDVNIGLIPIPKNTKGKISIPFIAENDIDNVAVLFTRGGIIKNIPVTD